MNDEERRLKNKNVLGTFRMIQFGGEEGIGAFETALMDISNAVLHAKRESLDPLIESAGTMSDAPTPDIDKAYQGRLYRAIAKTALRTGMRPSPELLQRVTKDGIWVDPGAFEEASKPGTGWERWRDIKIPEYERKDGTVVSEHVRRVLTGDSDLARQTQDEAASVLEEVREYQRSQNPDMARDFLNLANNVDLSIERAHDYVHGSPVVEGAVNEFLGASTIGQGVLAVSQFLSHTTNTFQFATKAIWEFGPRVGVQMARAYFRHGGYDLPMTPMGDQVLTELGDVLPPPGDLDNTRSSLLGILSRRLPGEAAEQGGSSPPSEGFIVDRQGNVLAHAVGRGDDNYLPFNNAHLRTARQTEGVEIIRRRMYGGPTAEDLRTAMRVGADRVTVISNGGVISFDVSPRAHGIKVDHVQIVAAYQQHLDRQQQNRQSYLDAISHNSQVFRSEQRVRVPDSDYALDFGAYQTALGALSAEFPLHITSISSKVTNQNWANRHDRIQPRESIFSSLMSGVSGLLGIDSTAQVIADMNTQSRANQEPAQQQAPATQQESGTRSQWSWRQPSGYTSEPAPRTTSTTSAQDRPQPQRATPVTPPDQSLRPVRDNSGRIQLPGRMKDEGIKDWYDRRKREGNAAALLATLGEFYSQPNMNIPNWFTEEIERARQPASTTSTTAPPPSAAPVQVRQVDPALDAGQRAEERTAPRIASIDNLDTESRQRVEQALDSMGLTFSSMNRAKAGALRHIASAAQTEESWLDYLSSGEGERELDIAFPYDPFNR